MNAVAIDARGDVVIPDGEALAVNAGFVKLELIDALLRAEAAHEIRIAVTLRAELRNRRAARLADESLGFVHRDRRIVAGAIAAVTIGATQSVRGVHVVLDEQRGTLDRAVHGGVTLHTGVFGRCAEQQRGSEEKQERFHLTYPKTVKTAR